MDNQLSMKNQINHIIGSCFGVIRSLRKVFKWIPTEARKPLVQGLIINRMDYGNALLLSINEGLLDRLQILQNTAARLGPGSPIQIPLRTLFEISTLAPCEKANLLQGSLPDPQTDVR